MKKLLITLLVIIIVSSVVYVKNSEKEETAGGSLQNQTSDSERATTHECSGIPIPELAEGPYYKPGSPRATTLYSPGVAGEKLVVEGYVLDTDCRPIAGAWLDFWQTDGNGDYDNAGYTFRGHQFTDASGKYSLTTVVPGEYPGRTAHIHFKVRASEKTPIITSQLFFPDAESNETDTIFDQSLVVMMEDTNEGKVARYNIVIDGR